MSEKIWRVYRYRNVVTDQSYIGQTTICVSRRASLGHRYKKGTAFRNAIDEYGWDSFEQSILRLCTTQEEANYYEQLFIEKYNTVFPNGYNMETGGKHSKVHEVSKQKISSSKIGHDVPEETRRKISASAKGRTAWNKGQKMSDEQKQKISQSKKGQIPWNKRQSI